MAAPRCNAPLTALLLIMVLCYSGPAHALVCCAGAPSPGLNGGAPIVVPVDTPGPDQLCMRYQFQCTSTKDNACSQANVAARRVLWAYIPATQQQCAQMKAMPTVYLSVECCATPLCNKPLR